MWSEVPHVDQRLQGVAFTFPPADGHRCRAESPDGLFGDDLENVRERVGTQHRLRYPQQGLEHRDLGGGADELVDHRGPLAVGGLPHLGAVDAGSRAQNTLSVHIGPLHTLRRTEDGAGLVCKDSRCRALVQR